jgi:hypothetical protein|tara:strand:- start:5460 stop:5951 length:492 start_codon:yes stop_codon:yes gene_type:complete
MNNQNGRVNIMGPNLTTKFSMMDKIPINTNTNYQNVLTGNFERSRLSDSFFSQQNIQIIQNSLRKGVHDKSGGKILIDNQPQDSIVSIMRSMYLQHSKNLETNIPGQIQELNNYVLNYAINNVYSEAVAYIKYRQDASTMHVPMSAPIYSNKTNKTLEQKPWF